MGKIAAFLLAVLGGISTGFQPPINANLGKFVGALESALISFGVGTITLVALVLFLGKGDLTKLTQTPLYLFTGGLLGVTMVVVSILVVGQIGATGLMASVFTGQIVAAICIDYFGLFGLPKQGIGWQRLVGLALLLAGTKFVLIKR
jgi:transporter family-2 protein